MSAEVEIATVTKEALAIAGEGGSIVVSNPAEFEAASAWLTATCKPAQKRVVGFFEPMKSAAHAAWKSIVAREKEILMPLEEVEARLKRGISTYAAEQDRIRRASEAAAQQALRAAEEAARIERDAQAMAKLEAGDEAAATAILEAPVVLPPSAPPVMTPRPAAVGIAVRKSWTFRIVDEAKIPRQFLVVDEAKIRKLVAALGPDAAASCPGIVVEESFGISARAK